MTELSTAWTPKLAYDALEEAGAKPRNGAWYKGSKILIGDKVVNEFPAIAGELALEMISRKHYRRDMKRLTGKGKGKKKEDWK